MKRKLLIVVGVALAAATISTLVFYQLISGSFETETAQDMQQFQVVTATRDLPRGTRLTPEDLEVVAWPGETAPQGAFSQPGVLAGRMVDRDIVQGEPVFESGLIGPGQTVGAGAIPPGMRAVSIHLDEFAGIARLIENGDRVDVLVADSDRRPGKLDTQLHTVLQGVEVLDAGKDDEPGSRRGGSPVVTLLVMAEDAGVLSLADQAGAIRLALRNPLDSTTGEATGARWRDVTTDKSASRGRNESQRTRNVSQAARPSPSLEARASEKRQAKAETDVAVIPDLHARRPNAKTAADEQGKDTAKVMLAITFAGMGDEALTELTAGLQERYMGAPVILSAFRPGWDVRERIQALQQKQRLEVFADPNLLAIDASEARFERVSNASADARLRWEPGRVSGGCADRVGVRVSFLPTVGEDGKLRMRVTSEVSVPDAEQANARNGCEMPLALRKWSGEIELVDGQSFWVRGLIDRPGAWDFLRRLFPQKPLELDRNDELAILVTPKVVAASNSEPLSAVLP